MVWHQCTLKNAANIAHRVNKYVFKLRVGNLIRASRLVMKAIESLDIWWWLVYTPKPVQEHWVTWIDLHRVTIEKLQNTMT